MSNKIPQFASLTVFLLLAVLVVFAVFDHPNDDWLPTNGGVQCPIYGFASANNIGQTVTAGQQAAFVNTQGSYACPGCGWRGSGLAANGNCPNCFLAQGNGFAQQQGANVQGASWLWRRSANTAATPTPPPDSLYCPSCNFSMCARYEILPNSVKCPKCAGFLASTSSNSINGGQQAAFTQGAGRGLGYGAGLNPLCPIR